jgi:hypothetical protein
MARLPSWVIVAAVGAVVLVAVADGLRSTGNGPSRASVATTAPTAANELTGVLLVGRDCRSMLAIRLRDLVQLQLRGQIPWDCDGLVWSDDGTLYASCVRGQTTVGTAEGRPAFHIAGCAPAWREDGALGVIRAGGLVVARTHGRPVEVLSRKALGEQLRGVVERPETYELTQIAWIGLNRFAALVHGARPWEEALVIFTTRGGLDQALTQYGAGIADLRVSPQGHYLVFARTRLGREFVMTGIDSGTNVTLPRIGNALNVAWSPDETHVAISTRKTTYVAEVGDRRPLLEVPHGGRYLAWLS